MTTQFQQQELALDDLRGLYELVRALHPARGLDAIVAVFLEKLNDVVPFDSCAVMLADDSSDSFEITHAAGEHAASLVGRKVLSGERISGWVLANQHPFYNTDPRLDLPSSLAERFKDYRTLAVFPLKKGNHLFGAVALYSSSLTEYDSTHQRLLGEASDLLALAMAGMPQVEVAQLRVKATPVNSPASRVPAYNNSPFHPAYVLASEHSH